MGRKKQKYSKLRHNHKSSHADTGGETFSLKPYTGKTQHCWLFVTQIKWSETSQSLYTCEQENQKCSVQIRRAEKQTFDLLVIKICILVNQWCFVETE